MKRSIEGAFALSLPFAIAFAGCSASDQLLRHPTPYARDSVECVKPIACEASDRNALAVNLVHFRAGEARRAQQAGRSSDCQVAARAAMAVARGLLETRRYEHSRGAPAVVYRTRFAGDLPERAALQGVIRDATAAGSSYQACGGALPISITPKEQYALFGGSPANKDANRRFWTNVANGAASSASAGGGGGGDGNDTCMNAGMVATGFGPDVCCSHHTHKEEVHGNTIGTEDVCD
jgi:hypothetical protein